MSTGVKGKCIKLVLKLLHTLALGHTGKKKLFKVSFTVSEQGSAELVH